MNIIFLNTLSKEYIEQIKNLFDDINFASIEQYPQFSEITYPDEKSYHALLFSADKILGYSQIRVKKHLIASIYFGPLVKTEEHYRTMIEGIQKYFQKKFIAALRIFPPYNSSQFNYLQTITPKNLQSNKLNKAFNWSTLILNINKSDEEILAHFSSNHKRSIKKAIKEGLKTELLESKDIETFNQQFCEMYASRNLKINSKNNLKKLKNIFEFFQTHNKGFFIGVKHNEQLVGGLCVSFGNDVAFYFLGYAHPDYRKLPINHIAFYESIKYARDKGISNFDFGGYASDTDQTDQLSKINEFKMGFGGTIVSYPKTIEMRCSNLTGLFLDVYSKVKT